MVGHGAKFGQKMEQAIVALLSHRSIEDAAREVGVSANTLLRWMREPEFEEACRDARRTVFSMPSDDYRMLPAQPLRPY